VGQPSLYATFTFYIQIPRANKRPSRSTEELFHASGMLLFLSKYHEPATVKIHQQQKIYKKQFYIIDPYSKINQVNFTFLFSTYLVIKHCVDDF